jgi:site-specific DNA-cytosine methylase
MDVVCDDFTRMDYTVRAAILPAYSAGFDHARERIYFAGHTYRDGESSVPVDEEMAWMSWPRSYTRGMGAKDGLPDVVGQMRAFGNAIVPQVAQVFIESYLDTMRTG